jgi:hypothetical protein
MHQIQPPNNQDCLDVGTNLKICQLNIEGISRSQREYLARHMQDEDVDVQGRTGHCGDATIPRGSVLRIRGLFLRMHGILKIFCFFREFVAFLK